MSTSGIYGLSGSGIDVDSMVKMGMMTKQNEYDKLYKKEVKNEWLKEAYAEVYSDLKTFNNTTMSSYKMSSATMPMEVSSTTSSVATATANADAAEMSHTVTVNSLSSNAYLLTKDKITRLSDSSTTGDADSSTSSSIYLTSLIDTSNWGDDDGISLTVSDGSTTATITLTKAQIVDDKETLNDLAAAFKNAGLNLTASYDSTNDAFTIYNKDGGSANKISITANNDDSAALMSALGLAAVTTDYSTGSPVTSMGEAMTFTTGTAQATAGTDASVVIDGKTYSANSNKLSVANVTYTFSSVGSTTMTVAQDTDAVIATVKQFVEDYNKMLDSLNDKYSETKYSDYDVLTTSQESSMTSEQIDKWNEKAKSGLLYHDSNISKIISSMREALYTTVDSVESSYNSMMAIGITSSTNQGHITLDEDKLKEALAADPDCVYQLFASSGDVTDASGNTTTDYNSEGVINRIYDAVNNSMKTMKDYAGTSTSADDGSTLGDLINELKTKMSNFKTMMDAYEDLLYDKYDAMEVAISQLSASYNYITS